MKTKYLFPNKFYSLSNNACQFGHFEGYSGHAKRRRNRRNRLIYLLCSVVCASGLFLSALHLSKIIFQLTRLSVRMSISYYLPLFTINIWLMTCTSIVWNHFQNWIFITKISKIIFVLPKFLEIRFIFKTRSGCFQNGCIM